MLVATLRVDPEGGPPAGQDLLRVCRRGPRDPGDRLKPVTVLTLYEGGVTGEP